MTRQEKWDKYEAVILLDYYLKYINGNLTRKEAIENTSIELRNMAILNNKIIDDIYRNVNGITFQMHRMESAYKGFTIVYSATKLFTEIVNLYFENRENFIKLLKEARGLTENKDNNRDMFLKWLSVKVAPAKISEFCKLYEIIDEYCMKTNVLKKSILETTDANLVKSAKLTIEQSRIFRFKNKNQITKIYSAMQQYIIYLKESLNNEPKENKDKFCEYKPIENINENHIDTFHQKVYDEECINIDSECNISCKNIIQIENGSDISDKFFKWLSEDQGMSNPTCRSYVSAISTAEKYAKDNNFQNCQLYINNYQIAKSTSNELFNNKEFIEYNIKQHNRFSAAINKLLIYIGNEKNCTYINDPTINLEMFSELLIKNFPKGYRIGSPLELRKFKKYWEIMYSNILEMEDENIIKCIKKCGIINDDKVYIPKIMLDDNTKVKLFSYINNSFDSGKVILYYESLFKEFSDDFLDCYMYNSNMLKEYLSYMNEGNYYTNINFISKYSNTEINPYNEIKTCLEENRTPMRYSDIFKILSHIPEKKIKSALAQNSEFISNGREEYFHINIVNLSDDEIEDIAEIIHISINEKDFISGNELINSIKQKYHYIIDDNSVLSDIGLRNAIGYKLKDRFSFKGNIISRFGQALSMMEVFADFCKNKVSFTLDELKVLKQELDTSIYFDAVYENSLRISKDKFVSKSQAAFQLEKTDEAIDRFCNGDYIAIAKIKQFGSFPDAGFSWNSFLLEHYVAMYSQNYKLIHSTYNEGVCVGGIVKKNSPINTLDELIIDVIAKNGLVLQRDVALQFLCDEGYLARRSYSGIEQALIKAKELRNQKGL